MPATAVRCPSCGDQLTLTGKARAAAEPGTLPASPRRLPDGETWGARVSAEHSTELRPGDIIDLTVTARSGKRWRETGRVIEIDPHGALCERHDGPVTPPQQSHPQAPRRHGHALDPEQEPF